MSKPKAAVIPLAPSMPEILTSQEAADAMRLSLKAFMRLPIPFARVGRFRRYLRADLLRWLQQKAS